MWSHAPNALIRPAALTDLRRGRAALRPPDLCENDVDSLCFDVLSKVRGTLFTRRTGGSCGAGVPCVAPTAAAVWIRPVPHAASSSTPASHCLAAAYAHKGRRAHPLLSGPGAHRRRTAAMQGEHRSLQHHIRWSQDQADTPWLQPTCLAATRSTAAAPPLPTPTTSRAGQRPGWAPQQQPHLPSQALLPAGPPLLLLAGRRRRALQLLHRAPPGPQVAQQLEGPHVV